MENHSPVSTPDLEEAASISELEKEEKRHLIDSILSRGEICLLNGDLSGLDLFETGTKLDPENPSLFFRQGLALYELGCEEDQERHLFGANKKFRKASALNPTDFRVWHAWGNSLCTLGVHFDEMHYFEQAKEKYTRALEHVKQDSSQDLSELYWDFANSLMYIGEHSGEALDLRLALNAFQTSSEQNNALPADFWVDYGKGNLLLAQRIGDIRLNIKAINALRHALTNEPSNFEAWTTLADALCKLYTHTHEEDHFSQAHECFAAAYAIESQDGSLLYDWANFLLDAGKKKSDLKRLHAAIEKCRLALACDFEVPLIMAIRNEALAIIGLISERLNLIFEAENKMASVVDQNPDIPALWHAHGVCLDALGAYFKDEDYYYQAIEKHQEGLSLDRSQDTLWHAMALSYGAIAHLQDDTDAFEKSLRFFNKALHLKKSTYYLADFAFCLSRWGELNHNQSYLQHAANLYEQALHIQKNGAYLHPDWLFHYATTLDALGDFYDDDTYYLRAIEILSHVLMIDPDFPNIHHRLALAFTHLAELASSCDYFYKAGHHFRLASSRDEENDQIILDWALSYISLTEHMHDREAADGIFRDAEHKLIKAAKLGNVQAFYHLGCLASILRQHDSALRFLEKADRFDALPPLDEILEDEWLDNIKNLPEFRAFVSRLESKAHHVGDDN